MKDNVLGRCTLRFCSTHSSARRRRSRRERRCLRIDPRRTASTNRSSRGRPSSSCSAKSAAELAQLGCNFARFRLRSIERFVACRTRNGARRWMGASRVGCGRGGCFWTGMTGGRMIRRASCCSRGETCRGEARRRRNEARRWRGRHERSVTGSRGDKHRRRRRRGRGGLRCRSPLRERHPARIGLFARLLAPPR